MIGVFLLACGPIGEPQVSVYATVEGQDVQIEWTDVLLRPAEQPWDSSWTILDSADITTINSDEYALIADGAPKATDYLHLFADAKQIVGANGEIDDIIEPIATPFYLEGSWRIDLTLIILNVNGSDQIFAKDAVAYSE